MKLSRRVALGNQQMDQIDTAVVIRNVDPGTTRETVEAVNRMGGSGQRITGQHWESLEASVTFAINIPKKQLAERRAVFDQVIAWAMNKGWLTISFMPGKRMYVEKVSVPKSTDLFNWNAEYTITFRAYGVPFWQDSTATTAAVALADEGNGSITVPGNVETVCDAEVTNAGESSIDTMTVKTGSSSMSFSDLGLAAGEKLEIKHGNNGLLTIRIRSAGGVLRSVMDKRTGGSADDLTVTPGNRAIKITGGDVTATVSCFGRYV